MGEPAEIADLTAAEMVEAFGRGALSPVEAAQACLARIDRWNDRVRAYNFLDRDTTLAAARRSEERWRRRTPLGPLDGVPVAIKDIFATRGWPNRRGSRITPEEPGAVDAPAVAALRRAGCVPLGRTTTPELGWKGVTDSPLDGVTRNPWNPERNPGGSSGGSAAAVPLGMGPLALGTDAGGSIRIPAAFCGLFGHKPTHGLCPMWPPSPFAPLAHVGPLTWTVRDGALLLDALAEPDPRDLTLPPRAPAFAASLPGGVKGLRIAFSPDLGFVRVHDEVARAVADAALVLEEQGAHVERCDPGFADPREAFDRLFYGGAAQALRAIPRKDRERMDPNLVAVAEWAEGLSLLDYLEAMAVRAALTDRMNLFHERFDLLVTPTLPIPAFGAGREVPEGASDPRWPGWTPFTYPFNLTGQPAASVPCGFTAEGLPIGLHVVGARHDDLRVLRAAHAYQQARPLTHLRPRPD